VLVIKILSLGVPERYAVRRLVTAAYQELLPEHPGLEIQISEVSDSTEIGRAALTLVLPTLVVNGLVVCTGRFPSKQEVAGWLQEAVKQEKR